MKSSTLLQHIILAIGLSCFALMSRLFLSHFLPSEINHKLIFSLTLLLYLGFLSWQSDKTVGKISLLLIDLAIIAGCLLLGLYDSLLILIYVLLIWINRSLLYYSKLFAVAADLGLCILSLALVYWLIINAYSGEIALWCLLLLQSLHCVLVNQKTAEKTQIKEDFEQAYQTAEKAVQQLLSES